MERTEWETAVSKVLLRLIQQDPWIDWTDIDLTPLVESASKESS